MNIFRRSETRWSLITSVFLMNLILMVRSETTSSYDSGSFTMPPRTTLIHSSAFDGSVLPGCAKKLSEAAMEQVHNNTATVEVNFCRNIPNFVSCVKTGLSQQSKWAEIDQLLFGVMYDLDGLKAAYAEMCGRIEYFANRTCFNGSEGSALLYACLSTNFEKAYSIMKSEQSHICSVYREHTNCTATKPPSDVCDEDFLAYLDKNNRRILKPECRRLLYNEDVNVGARVVQSGLTILVGLVAVIVNHIAT